MTEGNVGGPPKGTNVVERFIVGISVKPDATQGVAVNADLGSAAWAGHTQVTLSITWQDPTNAPWKDMDFLLSSKVRCSACIAPRAQAGLLRGMVRPQSRADVLAGPELLMAHVSPREVASGAAACHQMCTHE